MALSTALQIKNTKEDGWYAITGAKGLYLRVVGEKKNYYFRYTCAGKRKVMVIGPCNTLTLSQAREKAFGLQQKVRDGTDPAAERKEKFAFTNQQIEKKKKENSIFKFLALKFVHERAVNRYWKNNVKGERDMISRLTNHIFPFIGNMDINEIKPENIRDLMVPVWSRSPSTSSKILCDVRAVFRWTIALEYRTVPFNPADLSGSLGVLLEPYNKNRKIEETHASIDFKEIPAFVKEISSLISPSSEMLLLSIFLAARSKAVRNMKWSDIDLENKTWTIPLEDDKIKTGKTRNQIFLNEAAVNLLKRATRFFECPYVFSNSYGKPFSDMAMTQVIRKAHARKKIIDGIGWIDEEKTARTGIESIATQHGTARSTFRTWAKSDELGNNRKYDQEAVELCLLHSRNDPYKGAYDRSKLEKERRTIMEDWGRYCTSLLEEE
ncbi:tyrosine-type recombinase/integrase [uncultured Turicimonas sp.]|uniref:tyrosine-type recombinase/integrase n=1 Tax=uncultured Turicimonas sp. TaxID=1918607 RepID=UPI002805CBC6|nr:integrase family protein [uncultured Turicimonas sp.]